MAVQLETVYRRSNHGRGHHRDRPFRNFGYSVSCSAGIGRCNDLLYPSDFDEGRTDRNREGENLLAVQKGISYG